jgi:protein-disulfide isomerase
LLAGCGQSDSPLSNLAARAGAAVPAAHAAEPEGSCACKESAAAKDDSRTPIDVSGAAVRGDPQAPVTIAVFSDYECPFCVKAAGVLDELEAAYRGKVRIVQKERPMPFHANARLAAKAALAAGEQGKYWEMHDRLLASRGALTRADLERHARELGLDGARFRGSLDSAALDARIDADGRMADAAKIEGVPTTFINGRRVVGAQPREAFEAIVKEELASGR